MPRTKELPAPAYFITANASIAGNWATIEAYILDLFNKLDLFAIAGTTEPTANGAIHYHAAAIMKTPVFRTAIRTRLPIFKKASDYAIKLIATLDTDLYNRLEYLNKLNPVVMIGPVPNIPPGINYTIIDTTLPGINARAATQPATAKSLKTNPNAAWIDALVTCLNLWQSAPPDCWWHHHVFITGPSGTGKSFAAKAVPALLNVPLNNVCSITVDKSEFFLEEFIPSIHNILIIEECTNDNLPLSKLSLLKAILSGESFSLQRKNHQHQSHGPWRGLCIMISNYSFHDVFGIETPNFIRRLVPIPATIPNAPNGVPAITRAAVIEHYIRDIEMTEPLAREAAASIFGPELGHENIRLRY